MRLTEAIHQHRPGMQRTLQFRGWSITARWSLAERAMTLALMGLYIPESVMRTMIEAGGVVAVLLAMVMLLCGIWIFLQAFSKDWAASTLAYLPFIGLAIAFLVLALLSLMARQPGLMTAIMVFGAVGALMGATNAALTD